MLFDIQTMKPFISIPCTWSDVERSLKVIGSDTV